MLYVVCTYMFVCVIALIVFPTHIPEKRKLQPTIFDREEKHPCDDDDIEKIVNEFINDTN